MKIKNRLTLVLFALTALLAGCTQGELPTGAPARPGEDADGGELVNVQVNFETVPLRSPLDDARDNGTDAHLRTAGEPRTVWSKREGAVKMELVETPQMPATRAITSPSSNVKTLWILQFDGKADDSKLKYKKYYEYENATNHISSLSLITGIGQRVVVVANASADAFDSYVVGVDTYKKLQEAGKAIDGSEAGALFPSGADLYILRNGVYEGDILPGTTISMPLKSLVSHVHLSLFLGGDFNATFSAGSWTLSMMNVPAKLYYLGAPSGNAIFPAAPVPMVDYPEVTSITLQSASVYSYYWYLPPNMRGTVPGATGKTRRTDAPPYATYLKITGKSTASDYYKYYLNLGANFADDYNLKPNYSYTYKVTLYPDPEGTDSRVEVARGVSFVGRLGGELVKNENGEWQYAKDLYVSTQDDSGGILYGPTGAGGGGAYDGRVNTLAIAQLGSDYAGWLCWKKNGALNPATTTKDDPAYQWFMPTMQELLAVWITKTSYSGSSFSGTAYWTSRPTGNSSSWMVDLVAGHGGTAKWGSPAASMPLRCTMVQ